MTLDKIKFASGRALRSATLLAGASPPDANLNPGCIVLTAGGTPLISTPNDIFGNFAYRPIFTLSPDGRSGQIGVISDANFSRFSLVRGKTTPSIVVANGDVLGSYGFAGRFAAGQSESQFTTCRLSAVIDGATTSTSYPTAFDVFVTANSATNPALALRVSPAGNLLIGNTTGTERLSVTGNIQVTEATDGFRVGTNQVLGSRKTGWSAPTGTATRGTFVTSTVTTAELAERVKALIDDLISHGAIGA